MHAVIVPWLHRDVSRKPAAGASVSKVAVSSGAALLRLFLPDAPDSQELVERIVVRARPMCLFPLRPVGVTMGRECIVVKRVLDVLGSLGADSCWCAPIWLVVASWSK